MRQLVRAACAVATEESSSPCVRSISHVVVPKVQHADVYARHIADIVSLSSCTSNPNADDAMKP